MVKNYLKVGLRNIWNAKLHAFITIVGLAVGVAACLLIILFVKDEWTFDRFHTKADRIYRAWTFENYGEDEQFFNTVTPYPLGPALKENFSEVAAFTRFVNANQVVKVGVDAFNEQVAVASPTFFQIFDFTVVQGKPTNALTDKNAIILSESMVQKYFGLNDPIGETVIMDFGNGERIFVVKAVIEDIPTNSSIQFDLMISDLNNYELVSERAMQSWYNVSAETYAVLNPGADVEQLREKLPSMMKQVLGEDYVEGEYIIGLQSLLDIHLNPDMPVGIAPVSDPQYAYVLSAIALLILLLGSVNFIALSVSRSIGRSREIGIRKVVGARKNQLVIQFLCESVITAFFATILGLVMAYFNMSLFNELSGKELILKMDTFMVLTSLSLLLVIGVFSGSYPAFLLSNLRPISILKGRMGGKNSKQGLRRVLIGVQFMMTIFLISTTLFMRDQLHFLQNKNLGFDKEQLAVVQINAPQGEGLFDQISKGFSKGQLLLNELSGHPGIVSVGLANHMFGSGGWTNVGFTDAKDKYRTFDMLVVDDNYMGTVKMEMAEGRSFLKNNEGDKRRSLVVNEAFVEYMGWEEAVGKRLPSDQFEDHEVVGVVKNFNYNSLHAAVDPLVIVMDPLIIARGIENIGIGSNPFPKLFVRLEPGQIQVGLDLIKQVWDKITAAEEFEYTFVDQTLATQYIQELNLSKIVGLASILAAIIGCMGLFALAAINMEGRTKEVSIRKVLGASMKALLIMLSKEYVLLILISLIVSIPLTLYATSKWLEAFAYRISLGVDAFLITGGLTLLIALMTIAYSTIATAQKQPADTLKYE